MGCLGTKDDKGRRELTQGMASCPAWMLGETVRTGGCPRTVRTGGCPGRPYRLRWQELLSCAIMAIPAAAAAGITVLQNFYNLLSSLKSHISGRAITLVHPYAFSLMATEKKIFSFSFRLPIYRCTSLWTVVFIEHLFNRNGELLHC